MSGRVWLGLILPLFCLPLFVGLGDTDLVGDEAAHSFSVDRILETGDWLVPRSSLNEDVAFVEKPPLKFWIVAAPIRLGVFPLNEFSLRFWDALFGSIAFLYVFAIGGRMAGPVCGAVAVLVCFTYSPLLLDHGLRGNNMEATLFLSYCGGVYHYLRWAAAPDARSDRRHAFAVALFFALGFMTKFVAVLFLPVVLLAGTLLIGASRGKAVRDWRLWAAATALALSLATPWFVFATVKFGRPFWNEILIRQVFTRLTAHLDPAHLQPWSFYWMTLYKGFLYSGSYLLVLGGLLVLVVQTIRQRWVEGAIVLLWFVLPVAAISAGTSKLAHYVYPYVPPLALGAGYLAALALKVLPAPLDRALWAPNQYATEWMPRAIAALRRPAARKGLFTISATAVGILIATLAYGRIQLGVGDHVLLKSSGVWRPAIIAILCGVLAGESRRAARVVVPLLVAGLLPLPAYGEILGLLEVGEHPMRTARDCILRSAEREVAGSSGMYVSGFNSGAFGHEHYYYFRKIRPWEREDPPSFEKIFQYLYDPAHPRPVLLQDAIYQNFMHWAASPEGPVSDSAGTPPERVAFGAVVLVLPGPYAVCRTEIALAGLS